MLIIYLFWSLLNCFQKTYTSKPFTFKHSKMSDFDIVWDHDSVSFFMAFVSKDKFVIKIVILIITEIAKSWLTTHILVIWNLNFFKIRINFNRNYLHLSQFWQYFEEFLLDKVRALPADKRNGTFLIRDSTSSTGLKVHV